MLNAEWLPIIMQGIPCEVYVVDCATLRLLHANESACRRLHYSAAEMAQLKLMDIAPDLTEAHLREQVEAICKGAANDTVVQTRHRRKDGELYPVCLRFFYASSGTQQVFIAIGNEAGPAAGTVPESISPIQTVVSRMPVLIYRFVRAADGSCSFIYLSEGCENLLEVRIDDLYDDANLFLSLIVPNDRHSYRESMRTSAASLSAWNWEGRIRATEQKDLKWINLHATPFALPGGSVQWEGIMTNITESKSEQLKLKRSRAQLAELSAHVEAVKEQERARIAREIHDDMGGNLTAIKMALALLARRLPESDASLLEKASYVDTLIDRTIDSIHRIAGDLRPSVLDFGLIAAIAWQAKEFEKQTGIACSFETNKEDIQILPSHATALFRIVQEALANISKHAHASEVVIRLVRNEAQVRLEIADNGRGITAADYIKPGSFGIRGMKERAHALGCHFSINGEKGKGTCIGLTLSL